MRFSDLPSPEERILESIHTSQRKVVHSILGTLVPMLPIVPERAIGVRGGIRFDTPQVEATIVVTVTVFSGKSDSKGGLAGKSWSTSWQRNDKLVVGTPLRDNGLPGYTSPLWPNTSHLSILRCDVDGLDIGLTAKCKVVVRVQGESVGIG